MGAHARGSHEEPNAAAGAAAAGAAVGDEPVAAAVGSVDRPHGALAPAVLVAVVPHPSHGAGHRLALGVALCRRRQVLHLEEVAVPAIQCNAFMQAESRMLNAESRMPNAERVLQS
jgi:hypothetical protein